MQTQAFKLGLATAIHHAHVLICQCHIRVRKQVVTILSLIAWTPGSTLTSPSLLLMVVTAQAE